MTGSSFITNVQNEYEVQMFLGFFLHFKKEIGIVRYFLMSNYSNYFFRRLRDVAQATMWILVSLLQLDALGV